MHCLCLFCDDSHAVALIAHMGGVKTAPLEALGWLLPTLIAAKGVCIGNDGVFFDVWQHAPRHQLPWPRMYFVSWPIELWKHPDRFA